MKSQIFNLIILDESGSMSFVTRQTINGCNETLETISAVQEKFAETQEHVVSIYAFEDGRRPSRYIIKIMILGMGTRHSSPPCASGDRSTLALWAAMVVALPTGYEYPIHSLTGPGAMARPCECRP